MVSTHKIINPVKKRQKVSYRRLLQYGCQVNGLKKGIPTVIEQVVFIVKVIIKGRAGEIAVLAAFQRKQATYHVKKITSAQAGAGVAKQLTSKDQTTQLAMLDVEKGSAIDNWARQIRRALQIKGLQVYATGSEVLNHEFGNVAMAGLRKTEVISVLFIFVILILVFRSPVVPLVSLTTVGVSYLVAVSVIMNFVQRFNFPVSNFTLIFLVVVLFGIGTDYNILLYE